jgi:4-diphosphocytidyl-2-C-methyl-D-erythritol kinase
MTEPAVARAPAKLTRTLRVTGVRADGYHTIDAEMVTLELADHLTIDEHGSGLSVGGPYAAGVPTDGSNLVAKALALAGRRAHVHIEKRIPNGGGLGGGSADAAAVLRWAGWRDVAGAAAIGADVAFCLVGGRASVTGIGDIVDPLPANDETFTLVIPPLHCSTPAVYRAWDELGGPAGDHGNDLEPAATAVVPALAEWRVRIEAVCGQRPFLAGSGATWFLPGSHPELVAALTDAHVVVTRTDRP